MSKEYSMAANAHSIANYLGIEFGAAWQISKCRYKTRYATEEEAQATADEWGQHVYLCPICNGWHCSSSEPRKEGEE